MDLRVFCMDNFLTLESGEILIKTIRKNIRADMKKTILNALLKLLKMFSVDLLIVIRELINKAISKLKFKK